MLPKRELPIMYLRRLEAAQMLGVSLASIVRRINDGTLPSIKIGGSVLIPYSAITNLVPQNTNTINTNEVKS